MRAKLMVALFALLMSCAAAITASAETFHGTFTLPYEVHWGRTVLPAGNYAITMDGFNSPVIVRSASGKGRLVSAFPATGDALEGGCFLSIDYKAGRHTVRYMNVPSLGKVLIYEPLTRREREEIARGIRPQPLQVALAQK